MVRVARCLATVASTLAVIALVAPSPARAGLEAVDYRANDGSSARTFFKEGGLKLRGKCLSGDDLHVTARTTRSNAAIHYNAQYASTGASYAEQDDFDKADAEDLLGNLGVDDDASGQIVYSRPGGVNVTVDWLAERSDAYGGARECVFAGTARVLGRDSRDSLNYRADVGDAPTLFLERGGLRMNVTCIDSGGGGQLGVLIGGTTNDGVVRVNSQSAGNLSDDGTNNDTNASLTQNMFSVFLGDIALNDSSVGQIVFSSADGTNVSVDWMAEDNDADGIDALGKDCVFTGTIRVLQNADPKSLGLRFNGTLPITSFFSAGGLDLLAGCDGADQDIFADAAVDSSMIHYNGQAGDAAAHGAQNDLNPDAPWDLENGVADDASSGQLVYSTPTGAIVSADYLAEDGTDSLFGAGDCNFLGTAEVAGP